jgi:hypothetical protein
MSNAARAVDILALPKRRNRCLAVATGAGKAFQPEFLLTKTDSRRGENAGSFCLRARMLWEKSNEEHLHACHRISFCVCFYA